MPLELLATNRIRAIYDELQDVRQMPQDLKFVNRIPMVPAEDEEIMARYTGRVVAADIITDDSKAVVRAPNPIRLTQTKIPNLKHGEHFTQSIINVLQRIESNLRSNTAPSGRDVRVFDNWIADAMMRLEAGVYQRMEVIEVAMLLDSFTYNRMGVQISGTWGMPSDLKVTTGTVWSDSANATPISDLQTIQRVGREKYGINLNRFTFTTTDFLEMTATTEFRNKATLYAQLVLPSAATFPASGDIMMMQKLATPMLNGAEIEIYDTQAWTEGIDGTQTAANYLTVGKVLLTSTQGDNNPAYWDWANGIVTESVVASMAGEMVRGLAGPQEGPVSYVTLPNADLNPPDLIAWAVARGYSRKHKEAASAVITI